MGKKNFGAKFVLVKFELVRCSAAISESSCRPSFVSVLRAAEASWQYVFQFQETMFGFIMSRRNHEKGKCNDSTQAAHKARRAVSRVAAGYNPKGVIQ